jgi:hypothetical protein
MPHKKIIRWNLVLIIAIGLYGFFTDEPYWRDVGHGPWLYDYFFWFALAFNGPSGFLADYLSWHIHTTYVDYRFLIQYALWCLLLWPQWRFYDWLAHWYRKSFRRQVSVYVFASLLIAGGAIAAYQAWLFGHRPTDLFIDKFFWFVRIAGVACSGIVILMYVHIVASRIHSDKTVTAAEEP